MTTPTWPAGDGGPTPTWPAGEGGPRPTWPAGDGGLQGVEYPEVDVIGGALLSGEVLQAVAVVVLICTQAKLPLKGRGGQQAGRVAQGGLALGGLAQGWLAQGRLASSK